MPGKGEGIVGVSRTDHISLTRTEYRVFGSGFHSRPGSIKLRVPNVCEHYGWHEGFPDFRRGRESRSPDPYGLSFDRRHRLREGTGKAVRLDSHAGPRAEDLASSV